MSLFSHQKEIPELIFSLHLGGVARNGNFHKTNDMSKSADSQKKILLADDSVTMHRAVSLALKKTPYELLYCDNGKDALRLIKEHRPSVALLDLDMPELTGIEVAQKLREEPSLAHCQLVLLCGSFDEVNENEVEKAPVEGRLWKPFESRVLLTLLEKLIAAPAAAASSSKQEQLAASEATSEQTAVFEAPISRKNQAQRQAEDSLTENIISKPSQASDIKKSVEPTQQQMRVEDLFNPATPTSPQIHQETDSQTDLGMDHLKISEEATSPISRDDFENDFQADSFTQSAYSNEDEEMDLPRNMAEETFGNAFVSQEELNQELPPSQSQSKPDAQSWPDSSESSSKSIEEFPDTYTSSPKTEEFTEAGSFWDEDEVTQTKTNVAFSEQSFFPEIDLEPTETNYSLSEETTDSGVDFEVISERLPEVPSGAWLGEEHTKASTPELDDVLKASADELSRQVENNLMRSGPPRAYQNKAPSEASASNLKLPTDSEELRSLLQDIVQAEVSKAFNQQLKEELRRQLNIVLAELERM